MKRYQNNSILTLLRNHLVDYPTPANINYIWGLGSLAGIVLLIQIISGILLAMHYTPHIDLAFNSIEHVMRDIEYGWLLRYIHSNGASMFMLLIYFHIGRGMYYGSYNFPYELVWLSGCLVFFLAVTTAFIGYVLPWGQMSFWGATVITNLFSAIPYIGTPIVEWLWGGYSVGNATLNRFFSLHYILPFIISGIVLLHLALLHENGSNNPLGIRVDETKIPFYPYFYVKDIFGLSLLGILFGYFIYFDPNALGHPDNYVQGNPLITPEHIVPEWYFLPFYAILRAVPDKFWGVISMVGTMALLLPLPFVDPSFIRSSNFRPYYPWVFWIFVFNFIFLGWIGGQPVEEHFVKMGLLAMHINYFYFMSIPVLGYLETLIIFDAISGKPRPHLYPKKYKARSRVPHRIKPRGQRLL